MSDIPGEVLALVEKYGLPLVFEALLGLATGENITEIVQKTEERAMRIAADAEASVVLKEP